VAWMILLQASRNSSRVGWAAFSRLGTNSPTSLFEVSSSLPGYSTHLESSLPRIITATAIRRRAASDRSKVDL
jgi:hypothetical protein